MEPHLELASPKYKKSFLEALSEFQENGTDASLDMDRYIGDFDALMKHFEDEREGRNMAEGRVRQSIYWLVEGDKFIGRLAIRHTLNEKLMNVGGHIGYAIRPSERHKGYGSLALKLGLIKAKELGIKKALLTCKKTDEGSRKIIEKNGGIFENEVISDEGTPSLRFWITT